jgi:hypothetical protein
MKILLSLLTLLSVAQISGNSAPEAEMNTRDTSGILGEDDAASPPRTGVNGEGIWTRCGHGFGVNPITLGPTENLGGGFTLAKTTTAEPSMHSPSKSMGLPAMKQPTALPSFKGMKAKVTKFSPNKGTLSAAPLPQSRQPRISKI